MIAKTPLEVTLERIFWLAPQIFLHFLKLIFFPITLSIDQTAQVKFSHYLFHPYAILCFLIMFGLLFLSLISFFYVRRRGFFYLFILFIPFFFSLFPFLHILSPIYNLASERYLYSPLFFLIIGFSYILFSLISDFSQKKFIPHLSVIILLLILCTLSTRTYFRTLDWSDSYTLLTSAIKTSPNNLYKGLRLEMVASSLKTFQKDISQNTINKYNEASRRTLKKALIYFKNKKIKYQDKTPQVIKFYGLDPKTLEAKVAFLLAFTEYSNNSDPYKAYKIFEPYAKNLGFLDTIILDFYYQILFNTKNIDAAENILHKALNQRRFSPVLFVALSDLCEFKYNDLTLTEKYLNQSFKYFPYDPSTLFGLKRLYKKLNNAKEFAFYSYLYGLRTHDPESLKEAAHVYLALNNKEMSKNILQKLLREYINDPQVIQTKIIYEQIFGRL
ncbi:MAG: hypothetical protein HY094_07965 [Candidatus Melainabacteria bacterium]|nr:hypothetical protein [Candidatus Melainabacteria bacterium]